MWVRDNHKSAMRPTATDVVWSVCLLDTTMSCAKTSETAEPFEIRLGWAQGTMY